MGVTHRRRSRGWLALALAAVVAAVAGCGDSSGDDGVDRITLTIDVFGDQGFGYDQAVQRFMRDNPSVRVRQRGIGLSLGDYNARLTEWIESGQGAGDVVALEEGTIVQFKALQNKFVNLLDHGAAELQGNFLPWKWEQAVTPAGTLLGLGTDVGSMAMCYRKDLFAAAGLPTDRAQVGALWPTWDRFVAVGRQYTARQTNSRFVDAATNVFNTMLLQSAGAGAGYTYFDRSDKFVLATNPAVRTAWDIAVQMIQANLSAGLAANSPPWATGLGRAQFATLACPAWMTGAIQANAGVRAAGKWDIAKAPGNGGNWGGSFLAVPKQSRHQLEAVKLAKYLTSPESQIEAFNAVGNLPSSVKALDDPAVQTKRNEYFSGAPTGQIFSVGAKELQPVYLGAKNQAVRDVVEEALRSIEQGRRTPAQAWQDALIGGAAVAATPVS